VDFEAVVGDTNRLADGSIAVTLRYCSDERYDASAVTVVLKETRHRSVGYAAQIRLERCSETIVIVPFASLGNKADVRIAAYLLEADGDLRFVACRDFRSTRTSVTVADLVPAGTGSASGAASSSSVRGGITVSGSATAAAVGVSSQYAASSVGLLAQADVAASGDVIGASSPMAAVASKLSAIVRTAGIDAKVFVNGRGSDQSGPASASLSASMGSIVVVPASQRAAVEAAV